MSAESIIQRKVRSPRGVLSSRNVTAASANPTARRVTTAAANPTARRVTTAAANPTARRVTTTSDNPTARRVTTASANPTNRRVTNTSDNPTAKKGTTASANPTARRVTTASTNRSAKNFTTTLDNPTATRFTTALAYPRKVTTASVNPTASKITTALANPTARKVPTPSFYSTASQITTASVNPTATRVITTSANLTAKRVTTTSVNPTARKVISATNQIPAKVLTANTAARRVTTATKGTTAAADPTTLNPIVTQPSKNPRHFTSPDRSHIRSLTACNNRQSRSMILHEKPRISHPLKSVGSLQIKEQNNNKDPPNIYNQIILNRLQKLGLKPTQLNTTNPHRTSRKETLHRLKKAVIVLQDQLDFVEENEKECDEKRGMNFNSFMKAKNTELETILQGVNPYRSVMQAKLRRQIPMTSNRGDLPIPYDEFVGRGASFEIDPSLFPTRIPHKPHCHTFNNVPHGRLNSGMQAAPKGLSPFDRMRKCVVKGMTATPTGNGINEASSVTITNPNQNTEDSIAESEDNSNSTLLEKEYNYV